MCLLAFPSFPLHTSQPFQQIHQANQWLLFLRQPSPWYKCRRVGFTGFTRQKRGQKSEDCQLKHSTMFRDLPLPYICIVWSSHGQVNHPKITTWFVRKPASRIGHVPNMSEETSTHQPLRCMKSHSLSCGLLDAMRRRVNSNDTVTKQWF